MDNYNWKLFYSDKDGQHEIYIQNNGNVDDAIKELHESNRNAQVYDWKAIMPGHTIVEQLKILSDMDNIHPAQRDALKYAAGAMRMLEEDCERLRKEAETLERT